MVRSHVEAFGLAIPRRHRGRSEAAQERHAAQGRLAAPAMTGAGRSSGRRGRRALAAAILASLPVSAHALELTRSRDIPAPPAAVWALVGEFCAIGRWHPQVERCILSSDEDDETVRVQIRGLVVKGGLGTVVEVETTRDEASMSYSYSFVQGPLPVAAYNGSLAVRPNGAGSTVVWSGSFDAAGMSDADALADMEGVYERGLDGIAREAAR